MISPFLIEVEEQPIALKKLVEFYRGPGRESLLAWRTLAEQHRRIAFAGMGTSQFAPEAILCSLALQGIDASAWDAGEWLHCWPKMFGLPVLVSQSGESVETRKLAQRLPPPCVALTNSSDSTIARSSALNLPMHAGAESAISTKTYVNTLGLLHLMAAPASEIGRALDQLDQAADALSAKSPCVEEAADLLADAASIQFISRGPAMVAAKQAALTFMEGARLPASALTGGAFRHGPFELVDPFLKLVFFIPGGPARNLLASMASEAAAKDAPLVIITDQKISAPSRRVALLRIEPSTEELFNIAAAKVQALLLEAVGRRRGITAGLFRHCEKVTLRE